MIKQLKHADIRPPDHPRVITDRRRSPYHQTSDCRRLLTHFNVQRLLSIYEHTKMRGNVARNVRLTNSYNIRPVQLPVRLMYTKIGKKL